MPISGAKISHPERAVVAPATVDDTNWMDDVLGWDTEPSDDDPDST